MGTLQCDSLATVSSNGSRNIFRQSTWEKVVTNEKQSIGSSSVFVIGEDPVSTSWLAGLAETSGHQVTMFNSAEAFLNNYDGSTIGCVISDIRLPGMSGLELLKRLMERSWDIPIIMMSTNADVQTAVLALKNGAIDFVETTPSEPLMLDLIHSAVSLHKQRYRRRAEWANLKAQIGQLTPREYEVMQLVVEGLPNKVIAVDLGVSTKTVEAHRAHVMKKMAVRSLPDLVRMAIRARELQNGYARSDQSRVRTPVQP